MRTDLSWLRRPGIAAAIAMLAAAGIVGGVSTAGARENTTLFSVEGAVPCFSETKKTACATGESPSIAMETGETITWDFSSAVSIGMLHNAQRKAGAATADANWNKFTPMVQVGGTQSFRFTRAGVYEFVCGVHSTMTGTVTVTGDPVEATPTTTSVPTEEPTEEPTASPTFSATARPGATATPDSHLNTPAPGKAARTDTQAPQLTGVKAKAVSAGAKLSFSVSEPATLRIVARRGKRTVTSATLHVAAGKRSVTLHSSSLRKKGTYSLEVRAVDAMGNAASPVKTTLKVKR
jgi:plastocyanin